MAKLCSMMMGLLLCSAQAFAVGGDFEHWLKHQEVISTQRMLANVSPADAAPGAVVASPEKYAPNYYFHWVRDAALTMDTVLALYKVSSGTTQAALYDRMVAFARFSRQNQLTPTRTGVGEPKFYHDGTAFNDNWCRPQNDGPALRALTLTKFANYLLDRGQDVQFVTRELYDSKVPTGSVIKTDLEFVAHNWRAINCDIWEEVEGEHFYNKLVTRRALVEGAALANRLGDPGAASFYLMQAQALEPSILAHWDEGKGVFVPTINWKGGIWYKDSGLDSQVVLGVLHSEAMNFSDPRLLNTMKVMTERFSTLYPINQRAGIPGVGIGRYPEDRYDGARFEGGNPWVLNTAAFANVYYRAAQELLQQGSRDQAANYIAYGDQLMKRVQYHANPDGSLSEQIDRHSGYMTSARDLTWSHSEVMHAAWARRAALQLYYGSR